MRSSCRTLMALGVVAIAGLAVPTDAQAQAQPARKAAAPEAKKPARAKADDKAAAAPARAGAAKAAEARDKAAEARKKGDEASEDSEAGDEAHAKMGHGKAHGQLMKLRNTREARKKARIAQLKAKWGKDLLVHPAVRAEMKVHGWRMARLNRMKALAQESDKENKDKLVERIDKLIEKEMARHAKHMGVLKEHGGKDDAAEAKPGEQAKAGAGEKDKPADQAADKAKEATQ